MPGFADEDELYKYVGAIFERGFADDELGPKMAATAMVFETRCTEPEASIVVDMAGKKVHRGGDAGRPTPDAALLMTTETANAYWQGKVNLPFAMARNKIKVEGDVAKLLSLSPLAKKLFPQYVEILEADDRSDLLL
ncbi:sterol carrier protein (plasmid) [Pseudonocardia sp. EC080610-09]|uniref:SCP2 sterol-binding domain-containing protein n=1 Tax=unclassified Pseudonocardia TaxID=2619320 RepID=UPI000706B3DD|nr:MULTISPECIES: SCP2 sterol-binding domain-containing protein [unclassified Pseudonocardia]ALL79745.1 sterol carrier protein [Pseudonocardia sp. EC080610-09]ALL85178.1 sterol carrier protein [Pseudonocardia sp. EC080619-01]